MSQVIAKIDRVQIKAAVDGFPDSSGWQRFECRRLISSKGRRAWKEISKLEKIGGNYAFLFPKDMPEFSSPLSLILHAPNKSKIEFSFSVQEMESVSEGMFVAYVGKTSNLLQRLIWHFTDPSMKNTGAQVQKGLMDTGMTKAGAMKFILQNAVIFYRELPGPEQVANRDIIEVALWARYMAPFNIKSER